jgi:hypothetical protein
MKVYRWRMTMRSHLVCFFLFCVQAGLYFHKHNYLLQYRKTTVVTSKTLSKISLGLHRIWISLLPAWWPSVHGSRRPAKALNPTYFAIVVVSSALQNTIILFSLCMVVIHQLPTIFFFLMILKLNLLTGVFFTKTPSCLTDMASGSTSLHLLVTHL